VLLLSECLLLLISLSTQSGNFWIHPPVQSTDSGASRSSGRGGACRSFIKISLYYLPYSETYFIVILVKLPVLRPDFFLKLTSEIM
jgi:hypothetical protein